MWAHYAGEHTGFCLGFERSRDSTLADPARTKRVYYGEVYLAMDLDVVGLGWRVSIEPGVAITEEIEVDIQEPNLQTVIYSKAKDWEYEQEWRVLVPEGGRLSPYPGPLRKVIFGLRCEPDSRRRIQEAAMTSTEAQIQLAEIVSLPGSFTLGVRDLETLPRV
jgi:hypothetical protein